MKNILFSKDNSIRNAMKKLNKTAYKCILIVDDNSRLLGTLSDGDIRSALLKGFVLSDDIKKIYNPKPFKLIIDNYSIPQVKKIFLENKFDLIPIVNQEEVVVEFLVWEKVFGDKKKSMKSLSDTSVIIMAGGRGTRLKPFTNIFPKPLVPINDKTIIEIIINYFVDYQCNDFYLTLNYKSKILKAYFEELKPSYNISYFDEKTPLGTAGSLEYFKNKFNAPFFVTNCDIIIKADYHALMKYHINQGFDITLVASAKEYTIPYGTCELDEFGNLLQINEKPTYDFLINAGMYVLNPDILEFIPKNKFYHITQLISDAREHGKKIGVFPIHEDDWIDVGQWAEYKKAIKLL
jgi:dTDP-glucose pyrophosphorylase